MTKFREKLWCNEENDNVRKLIYLKEIINSKLEKSKLSFHCTQLEEEN
jgi:hypothetical protein